MPAQPAHVVLLIDDQPTIGAAVGKLLANETDIAFHYCQYPTEAIKMAEAVRPSVILQDLIMPDIDGLALIRYFRASPIAREVPLVVLSSKDDPGLKAEAFSLGANDYLVKLPDRLELLARIRYHSKAYKLLLERNAALEQNHLLLETAGEGIFGLDREGRTTFVNPAAAKMLDFTPQELLGRKQHGITHYAKPDGTPNPREDCPICTAVEHGNTFHSDREVFWRRNGTPFPVDYIVQPIRQEQQITGCVVTFRDITERKQVEIAMRQAKDAAEQASYSKSRFLANMSHELRTPLNAILGYSEMLQEELEDLEMGELVPDLKKIRAAGTHLLGLINDVLDISKIEAGKMDVFLEIFAVEQLLEEVSNTAEPLMEKKNNELHTDFGADLGEIHSDATKLRQMLLNLLSNAAKFTKNGTITLSVARETGEQGEQVRFAVTDTGIGMSAEQQGKIFDAFTQADASTTREYGGTGLGLAISKRFAEMLGGTLSVTSIFGQGSCFTLALPCDSSTLEIQSRIAAQETRPTAKGLGNIVLLACSDSDLAQEIYHDLSTHGYVVALAVQTEEVLELADKLRPDMIILDQTISDDTPQQLITRLQDSLVFGDIPILTLGISQTDLCTRKPVDCLPKPLVYEQLHTALKKYEVNREAPLLMVIDDAYDTRTVTSLLLRRAGWRVFSCENGRVGLGQLMERRPALIILDLMMPDMDGFEFLTHVRKDETWFKVPVIIYTASDLSEEEKLRLGGQAAAVINKGPSTSYKKLLDKVSELVEV